MLNKQTAVDIFHNRVNELIEEKKTITTFVIDGIWLECKEMEKEKHKQTYHQGLMSNFQNFDEYYNETYGGGDK